MIVVFSLIINGVDTGIFHVGASDSNDCFIIAERTYQDTDCSCDYFTGECSVGWRYTRKVKMCLQAGSADNGYTECEIDKNKYTVGYYMPCKNDRLHKDKLFYCMALAVGSGVGCLVVCAGDGFNLRNPGKIWKLVKNLRTKDLLKIECFYALVQQVQY